MSHFVWRPYNTSQLSPTRKKIFRLCQKEPNPERNYDCMRLYNYKMTQSQFIDKWKMSFSPWTRKEIDKIHVDKLKSNCVSACFIVNLKKNVQKHQPNFIKSTTSFDSKCKAATELHLDFNHFQHTLRS